MSVTVILPQIGQSIAEATIVKWFRKPGERIEKGQTLVEIGTDKINTEIPAPQTGVVETLLVQEGETVPVNTGIAVLRVEGQAAGKSSMKGERSEQEASIAVAEPSSEGGQRLSPFVRKLAREQNIDLSTVKGSGEGGRITKEDVLRIVEQKQARKVEPTIERTKMSRMRKLIADHMVHSKRTTAELTTFFEVDMTPVAIERDKCQEIFQTQHGIKLTYLPFVIYAVAKALREFPALNSSIEADEVVYKKEINIGIAVALEEGLLVPVIKRADRKSILELSLAAHDLSERARSKRLMPEDLEDGTFSITNPGVFGALMGTPIIHQPQVAILGLGAIVKRPVVLQDAIVIRSMAYLSLTYDHRALDGATADQFLALIKHTLEKQCPSALGEG